MFVRCKKSRSVLHVETWISFLRGIIVENILKSGKFRIQTTSVPRNVLYRCSVLTRQYVVGDLVSFLTPKELETKGIGLQENERSQVSLEDGVQSSLLGALKFSVRQWNTHKAQFWVPSMRVFWRQLACEQGHWVGKALANEATPSKGRERNQKRGGSAQPQVTWTTQPQPRRPPRLHLQSAATVDPLSLMSAEGTRWFPR